MIDFQQLIIDLEGHGLSQVEIADDIECGVNVISRLKTGRTPEPVHSVGENIVAYHKKICEQARIERAAHLKLCKSGQHMSYADKMQIIHRKGLSDSQVGSIVGYSESYIGSLRKGEKNKRGLVRIPLGDKADKIDALYKGRKDMPNKKVVSGWRKKSAEAFQVRMCNGFHLV